MASPFTLNLNNYNKPLYYSGPLSMRDVTTNRAENIHRELYDAALNDLIDDLGSFDYDKDDEKYSKAPFHFFGEMNYLWLDDSSDSDDSSEYDSSEYEDEEDFDYEDRTNPENPRIYISNYFTEENINSIIEMNGQEYWEPSSVYIIFKIFNLYNNKYIFVKKLYNLDSYWTPYRTKYEKNSTNVKVSKENLADTRIIHYDYLKGKATMQSKVHEIEYEMDFDLLSPNDFVDNELLLPRNLFIQSITLR